MGDLGMDDDRPYLPSFAAALNNPDPDTIREEAWVAADDPTQEVLNCIHPTLDSEEKRKYVIEFVQKLIRFNLRLEVFPYGSVPLKTYLPDGDIDLTVLSTPNLDEFLPREVLRVLEEEEQNGNTEFRVKDTQFIDAEVKLVKCLVQDIVIDISFNQLGGLCTLCFLEQVDRLAGKDHLFKRSIILIKAWCYYESRILGAHHGLISTYALETLVLYIFQVFHASLNDPVEVLYRFLDYYAKFDWDNFCVSLDGPVCKASLPNLAVESPDYQRTDVLLGAEFRKNCMDMFIVPSKGVETDLRGFILKNLNIIDPLKANNNLGRSVHKGNYFRIRSAFRYGARRLGKILKLPSSNIGDEIKMFFRNTLQRHKPKYGPAPALVFGANGLGNLSLSSPSEAYHEDDIYSRFSNGDLDDYMNDVSSLDETHSMSLQNDHSGALCNESNLDEEPLLENKESESVGERTGLELWMERGGMDSFSRGSSGRATTELHHMSKKWKDPRSAERSPEHTKVWTEPHSNNVNKQPRRVPVVYYLSRNGNLEHPHFIEVPLSSHDGRLYLHDVFERLNSLRGKGMATLYSWSSKRSYKNGFVWHDLAENDYIYPAHGQEYVLKGSELLVSSSEQGAPKDLSSPDFRLKSGDDFPVVRRRRNQSWSAVDLHEYKVYTGSSGECSALPAAAADASTQTDDNRRRRRPTIKEEEEERINETESSELSRGEISPPPSDSSPETLESLMKADGIVVVTQQEHNLKHNLPTNNNNNSNKMKASSVLMQLISCGSISCGPGGYGKDNPGFSLISHYKSRMLPRGERNVNVNGDENVVENAVVLRKNRKIKKQQQQMVVTEDKEYFSGSLIETKKEVFPAIKRSNSYTGNR